MTDLHCHILPNIDDGAKDVSISLRLLEKEYADGVRNIAFTSHFTSEWTTPDAFLQKRAAAYETLTAALPTGPEALQFRFKLGCEVYFSPKLCELDAKALCIGDTSYMLVEFPTTHKPHFIRQTFALLQEQGVLPLIAHIERYPYVLEDPTLLYNWVAAGAYVQINAGALLDSPKLRRTLCKFISWQLVHVISTDTHSLDKRPPRMAEAAAVLEKELGRETASKLLQNGAAISWRFSSVSVWLYCITKWPLEKPFVKSHTFSLTIHPFRGILSQAGQKGSSRTALSGPHPGAVRRRPVTPLLRCTVFLSTSIKPVWIFTA